MNRIECAKILEPQPATKYTKFPDLPDIWKSSLIPEKHTIFEELKNIKSTGEFLATVNKTAAEISKRSIPTGVDREKANKVLDYSDFTGVTPTDTEYDSLLTVGLAKASIERQIIKSIVGKNSKEKKDSLDLTDTERVVLLHSMDIGDGFDKFYWQWRQNVITSPLGLKLKEIKEQEELKEPEEKNPNVLKDYLKKNGAEIPDNEYIYVTFNQDKNGNIQTVPYAKEFREPITAISESIDNMLEDLNKITPKDKKEDKERLGLINYYQAFNRAIACTDAGLLEERYKNLDEVWFEVKGSMQPIHMMETYSDPMSNRVNPEYTLAFIDDRHKELNDRIVKTKTMLIAYLEKEFSNKKTFPQSKKLMEKTSIGIYSILGSGNMLDLPFAGTNLPDRPEVRLKHGAKIFEDLEFMKQRKEIFKELLTKLFGEDYMNLHFAANIDNISYSVSVYNPGHEIGHNFLIQEKTRRTLGEELEQQIEDHKADAVGRLIAMELELPEQQIAVQNILAWSLRDMTKRDNTAFKPYYYPALTYLKTMHEVGMLCQDNKGNFTFDGKKEKINAFFIKTKEILDELAEIYDTLNIKKAKDFMDKYYKEEPQFIKDIHSKLGLKPREQTQNHQ